MPTERQLENLKKGRKFRANDEATRQSAAKAAHAKHRNTRLRKLATEMLTATPETTEEMIRFLKRLGIDEDNPDLQTLMLARIGACAIGKEPRVAMQAAQLLIELTGNDAKTVNAAADRALQRERLDMLQAEMAQKNADGENNGELERLIVGFQNVTRDNAEQ